MYEIPYIEVFSACPSTKQFFHKISLIWRYLYVSPLMCLFVRVCELICCACISKRKVLLTMHRSDALSIVWIYQHSRNLRERYVSYVRKGMERWQFYIKKLTFNGGTERNWKKLCIVFQLKARYIDTVPVYLQILLNNSSWIFGLWRSVCLLIA